MLFLKEEEKHHTLLVECLMWTISPLSLCGGGPFLHLELYSRLQLAGGIQPLGFFRISVVGGMSDERTSQYIRNSRVDANGVMLFAYGSRSCSCEEGKRYNVRHQ
ncbi:hypothetical protein TNCV_1993951 [Trichonephila clavipes]|nr:hypothetical protein TNCV_1993951 [Trichonephila clavipes]